MNEDNITEVELTPKSARGRTNTLVAIVGIVVAAIVAIAVVALKANPTPAPPKPGAELSMPGMMDTVTNSGGER